jgi:hypothetical protein
MAKIKLGNRPKNFTRTVKFPMLEGGEGSIEVTYKYRTRTEFGAFIDRMAEDARKKHDAEQKARAEAEKTDEPAPDSTFSMAELMEKTKGSNAAYVLDVADGWNLDEDLNKANVEQLADEIPAAVNAIMETYRVAIMEGRLGN